MKTDGYSLGHPRMGGYGGVFRSCRGFVKSCFAIDLEIIFAFKVDFSVVVHF